MSYAPPQLRFFDGKFRPSVPADALYVQSLTFVAQTLIMPFSPILFKKIGARNSLLLGSWITAASVYLASYQTNLFSFMLTYSILFGIGLGFAYTAPMYAGWQWMPQRKGLVSGGVLAGFGAGGFLFSLIGFCNSHTTHTNSGFIFAHSDRLKFICAKCTMYREIPMDRPNQHN